MKSLLNGSIQIEKTSIQERAFCRYVWCLNRTPKTKYHNSIYCSMRCRNRQNYITHNAERLSNQKQYFLDHNEERLSYAQQYRQDHKGKLLAYMKQYRIGHREELRERSRLDRLKLKYEAMKRIGSVTCSKCGMDELILLEINHKNGGGNKEREALSSNTAFYRAIIKGERRTDDLEIICMACHRKQHSIELELNI